MQWYWWVVIGAVGGIIVAAVIMWILIEAALNDIFKRRK